MAKKFLRYALVALMLIGYTSASAAFKGFTIDFRSTDLVPAEEQVQWGAVEFGVVIAEDGTLSRVAVDDASADIVL
ncbi:MAG: hypothetical protein J6R27_02685, partial [Muribaculaceae bacterium]|nr:hypothetical protein [Muribaculaceae bacterium]